MLMTTTLKNCYGRLCSFRHFAATVRDETTVMISSLVVSVDHAFVLAENVTSFLFPLGSGGAPCQMK